MTIKHRGIYQYQSETNTHSITYYIGKRVFTISSNTLKELLSLSENFWSPRSDMTVTQFNRAHLASLDDTQVIELNKVS